jgi:hypothetical protein
MPTKDQPNEPSRSTTSFPPEFVAEFKEAVDDLATGIRRPEKMKAACDRMDRIREENRKLFGEQDIAVDLIRETRDPP